MSFRVAWAVSFALVHNSPGRICFRLLWSSSSTSKWAGPIPPPIPKANISAPRALQKGGRSPRRSVRGYIQCLATFNCPTRQVNRIHEHIALHFGLVGSGCFWRVLPRIDICWSVCSICWSVGRSVGQAVSLAWWSQAILPVGILCIAAEVALEETGDSPHILQAHAQPDSRRSGHNVVGVMGQMVSQHHVGRKTAWPARPGELAAQQLSDR